MAKSTDSKDGEAECEKCKKLIEMVFGREKPDSLFKQVETHVEDVEINKIQKVIAPNITTLNEKSKETNSLLSIENTKKEFEPIEKLTVESNNESLINNSTNQAALPLDNILKSTTAKTTEEQLAQKLESIKEPGLVEAASPTIDGFNTPPKVLGAQENVLDNKNSHRTKIRPEEDVMDEIARKCLGTPRDKIDERIFEEMKSCGMLGTGQIKPISKKYGYHTTKCNEKESLLDKKSEPNTLDYKNQQKISQFYNYPPMRYHNMEFTAHNPQNIYPAYFKNVPLGLVDAGHLDKKRTVEKIMATKTEDEKSILEDVNTTLQKEKPLVFCSENSTVAVDSDTKSVITNDHACNRSEISEEMSFTTTKKEKPKEIIENAEVEVEEIRVTAAETSCLGIPGETEIDPDFNHKHTKSEISPCSEILKTAANIEENLIESDKREYIDFSNAKHPADWQLTPDSPDQLNTAISGTYPKIEQKQESDPEKYDTSISSRQNPSEYFDLSRCNLSKVETDDYITSLSEIRLLAAYHQYTIITGAEELGESEQVLFSMKDSPQICLSHYFESKHYPQIEEQGLPKTMNKDISATMGPLHQLKDMDEELPLTEMLRRVRERNWLQYCHKCAFKAVEVEPVEANKCPPPLEKGPGKTLGPGPCKPKPKPACPPPPPPPPPAAPPCKPKDPCAKCTKPSIIGDKIKETFTLVLQVAFKLTFALSSLSYINQTNAVGQRQVLGGEDINRIEKFRSVLLSSFPETKKKQFGNEDITLAKNYNPWSPIPSWPNPKKEKQEPFVCPKEGCKIIPPPRHNSPCKEKPCINLPKKTFSLIVVEFIHLYLNDTNE